MKQKLFLLFMFGVLTALFFPAMASCHNEEQMTAQKNSVIMNQSAPTINVAVDVSISGMEDYVDDVSLQKHSAQVFANLIPNRNDNYAANASNSDDNFENSGFIIDTGQSSNNNVSEAIATTTSQKPEDTVIPAHTCANILKPYFIYTQKIQNNSEGQVELGIVIFKNLETNASVIIENVAKG